jgi:hypothetical protein
MPPDAGGEGMIGSRYRLRTAGASASMSAPTLTAQPFESTPHRLPHLAQHAPSGAGLNALLRLRPSLDLDASVRPSHNPVEKAKTRSATS